MGSLLGCRPGSLPLEPLEYSCALHGGWAFDGTLIADLDLLSAGLALESELNGILLHRSGNLHLAKDLTVVSSGELFPLLLEDSGRIPCSLARLHSQLPRAGDIGSKRETGTKQHGTDQFEHDSSAITEHHRHVTQGARSVNTDYWAASYL